MSKLYVLSTSLFLLAWLLTSLMPIRRPPVVNYDSTIFFNHDVTANPKGPLFLLPTKDWPKGLYTDTNLLLPRTREDIVWIIKSMAAATQKGEGRRIRVIGSGHSWSPVALSDDIQLSLEDYKGLVSVNTAQQQVTVRGGTTLDELNLILEEHGLAMKNLGSISDQTIAGAISTATHGSGVEFGNLATFVTKMELITGEGEVLLIEREKSPNLFKAAQVSIGLLGVITQVTLQCEPVFNLHETRYTLPLDSCLNNITNIIHSGEHVKFWIDIFTQMCAVFVSSRTNESPRDNPSRIVNNLKNNMFEALTLLASWMPRLSECIMSFIFDYGDPLPPLNRVDKSYGVLNIPHQFPVHNEGELVVPIEKCADSIRELRKFVLEEKIPLNYLTEIRFVQADDIWLSPNYQRDSCHLTLCIRNHDEKERLRYLLGAYHRLHYLNPRVHWGKVFELTPMDVDSLYPKYSEFKKIRARLDPQGLFLNKELTKLFGV